MKHYRDRLEPAKAVKYLDKIICDFCGDEIISEKYKDDEVTIIHRVGDSYPEGGSGYEYEVDMCSNCFRTKFTEWLNGQCVKLKRTQWDY